MKIHASGIIVSNAYAITSAAATRFDQSDGSTTEWAVAATVIAAVFSSSSAVLDPVQRLDVDIGETEHGDKKNDRERRRIAGAPLFKCFTLERDRSDLGGRSRPAGGEQVDHVEHLEVFDAAKQHRQHDERQRHRQCDRPELAPL